MNEAKVLTSTQQDKKVYARGDNGIILGMVMEGSVIFGMGTAQEQEHFISNHHAQEHIVKKIKELYGRDDLDFVEYVEQRAMIEIPFNGHRRKM